ncbi:cytochrome C oxidase subunit II, periplasmic domain protein [Paraburkholderia fungorum]|jgi:cytochrome c oxidase subunit 2|uniref:Cytochrome c oxidase subunit II n=1 Tax=Paraburkholderia fungorum TaxID=134537 RepID=A0AAP5UYN3_9BURK|nr:cytochrome c oxidase subunit II [Paraburkholderia fungorum]AJZ56754.1 cytochrome C oxidase subunit II, periplasmic domain protein [Paraburkholderia fungorum]MDT8843266.1 cytochrome c oxidase subunit II [Paraburkholderia fungorum]
MSLSSIPGHEDGPDVAARVERRWAIFVVGIIAVLVGMVIFTGLHWAMMPPSRVETINPATLHITGEFIESNLGSGIEPDGSVTVRVIGQQYSFTPQCLLVPAGTPITFRATSADDVHGFLITNTNVNSMLVPGYVSTFKTTFDHPGDHLMPCHEYCGVGHEGMWANVKVIDKATFFKMASTSRRLSCVQ